MSGIGLTPERVDELLAALGEQLLAARVRVEIVVIGGSALAALGLITRSTVDVDVVALVESGVLVAADPLPDELRHGVDRVAADFDLLPSWLNAEPSADLMRLGLPEGFQRRLVARDHGPSLRVQFAGRLDQIHLKLYAMVDRGLGKHEQDIRALAPTAEELVEAATWARTHDPSEPFRDELVKVLRYLGVSDAAV